MVRRDDQHHAVGRKVAERQMGVVGLATYQPEADFAAFHPGHHGHAVADSGTDSNLWMPLTESREEGWQQVLAGDRTGGEEQFTGGRRLTTPALPAAPPVLVPQFLVRVRSVLSRVGHPV